MLSSSTHGSARIFIEVKDVRTFLAQLERPGGAFVSTRLHPGLGDVLLLSARFEDVAAPIDLPVIVVGRRTPRGAGGLLSMGVQVAPVDRQHPMMVWLRRMAEAKSAAEATPTHVFSVFPLLSDLEHELHSLIAGERGFLPVDQQAHVGDRLIVKATAEDAPGSVEFTVLVRGVSLHDGIRAVSATLLDDEGRGVVQRFLGGRS